MNEEEAEQAETSLVLGDFERPVFDGPTEEEGRKKPAVPNKLKLNTENAGE